VEWTEKQLAAMLTTAPQLDELPKELQQELDDLREQIRSEKNEITQLLEGMIADLD
jgi:hypothetical protein